MNFYRYLNDLARGVAVTDEADYDPNNPTPGKYGLSHSDGSPCDAEKLENCPKERKIKSDEKLKQDADTIGENKGAVRNQDNGKLEYNRHISELKSILEDKNVQDSIPAIKGITFKAIAEAYDEVRKEYEEAKMSIGTDYMKGTRATAEKIYSENTDQTYQTFTMDGRNRTKELEGMDAWGVTFHTTRMSDQKDTGYVSDDEYDKRVAMLNKVSESDGPNVGIFQGKPEISVACPNIKKALVQMVMFEQNSIYNYKTGKTIFNLTYSEEANPGLERGTSHIG